QERVKRRPPEPCEPGQDPPHRRRRERPPPREEALAHEGPVDDLARRPPRRAPVERRLRRMRGPRPRDRLRSPPRHDEQPLARLRRPIVGRVQDAMLNAIPQRPERRQERLVSLPLPRGQRLAVRPNGTPVAELL